MHERGQLDQEAGSTAGATRAPASQVYQRHAAALYGQALLILGEHGMAERVACDVIIGESIRVVASPEDADATAGRLAVSVLRCCRALTSGPNPATPDNRVPRPRWPGGGAHADSPDLLRRREREALSLVIFGRFEYRQVARELAIPARAAAALLRGALINQGSLPADRHVRP